MFYLSTVSSPLHDKNFESDGNISCRIDQLIIPFYNTIHQLVWWVDKECHKSIFFSSLLSKENCIGSPCFLFVTAWISLDTSGETNPSVTFAYSLVCWDYFFVDGRYIANVKLITHVLRPVVLIDYLIWSMFWWRYVSYVRSKWTLSMWVLNAKTLYQQPATLLGFPAIAIVAKYCDDRYYDDSDRCFFYFILHSLHDLKLDSLNIAPVHYLSWVWPAHVKQNVYMKKTVSKSLAINWPLYCFCLGIVFRFVAAKFLWVYFCCVLFLWINAKVIITGLDDFKALFSS